MTEFGAVLLIIAAVLSIACALLAWKAFRPFQRSKAAQFKTSGYILMAISLGVFTFSTRVLDDLPIEVRRYISIMGLIIFDISLVLLLLGMYDLWKHIRPRPRDTSG